MVVIQEFRKSKLAIIIQYVHEYVCNIHWNIHVGAMGPTQLPRQLFHGA